MKKFTDLLQLILMFFLNHGEEDKLHMRTMVDLLDGQLPLNLQKLSLKNTTTIIRRISEKEELMKRSMDLLQLILMSSLSHGEEDRPHMSTMVDLLDGQLHQNLQKLSLKSTIITMEERRILVKEELMKRSTDLLQLILMYFLNHGEEVRLHMLITVERLDGQKPQNHQRKN